jgi:hypothetical protein
MHPLAAAVLVALATAGSVWLVSRVHGRERHRSLTVSQLVVVTVWFAVSYGFMAFLVIPH